ncbi:JmjC domain-containing protein [Plectosphaerella plurivora]|uniref:JmjC domain-containing protein n=1 Tax=Plectosphaerella plurivora TaxID=936078 RepID=A0A9P9AAP5_9PEZI|nr:JmjC domain-containing protein [Plectosphaerella plurivora]
MSTTSAWSKIQNLCETAARDILQDALDAIDSADALPVEDAPPAEASLVELPTDTLFSLKSIAEEVLTCLDPFSAASRDDLLKRLDDEIQRTYKHFYDFVYSDLPFRWRQLYTDLSILRFCLLLNTLDKPSTDSDDDVTEMVATLDKALILAGGAGVKRGRPAIEQMLRLLEEAHESVENVSPSPDGEPAAKRPRTQAAYLNAPSFSSLRTFTPKVDHPIKVFNQKSMDDFQNYMDQGHASSKDGPLPCIIRGLTSHWPAMTSRPWNKPAYLLSRTFNGRRLVPVEVGRSYVDEDWGQELITFRELLSRMQHTTTDPLPPPSYLAQHELFTQLPLLRNDIPTPDLCYTSPPPHPISSAMNKPELPLPLVNAWFGPGGTITPLHTDGYHNLLAQVVGAKYVRLYSPLDSEALCPRGEDDDGIDMHNTSAFDVGVAEGWDPPPPGEAAPDDIELEEFRSLRRWEAILEPGDVLYVPIGWWHYVRSLSVSFSVSFWWNGDHAGTADGSP